MQNLHLNMADAQRYINKGKVRYKGEILQEKAKLLHDCVQVLVFKSDSVGLKPLYENADFAIFNKPAKMLIHPKGRFHHHSLIDEVRAYLGNTANLTHRIDKETSGLVLVGKHKKSISELGESFANNKIEKEYLALVKGDFSKSKFGTKDFCLSLPLATQPKGGDLCVRSKFSGESHSSFLKFKEAKSEFEILGNFWDSKACYTLLKVRPKTGRTHQIRLHLSALGFPILGDPLYGTQDSHSREYLDAEFIAPKPIEKEKESQNQFCKSDCGLSDAKRIEYFGSTRLMLHAYSLRFHYNGNDYYFKSIENFEINQKTFNTF
ncbi:RluA family pseudouridine synthase [Helicobacter sp. MIT 11-5569]|nr:RluA family pseudouridine synthase [Helicobacter sp. MIT 11-5569]